jgi:hypothetical protein
MENGSGGFMGGSPMGHPTGVLIDLVFNGGA